MLVTHRKASIDEIERAWHGDVETILKWVGSQDKVEECAVLKTCNAWRSHVVSPRGEKVLFDLAKKARVSSRIIDFHDHDESLLHLLRLASGLESMIIGEDQILGQMKELIQIAMKAGTTNWMLETAFKKAIQVGKRVRKETHINERSVSVGSAAVDLAEEILGDLKGKSVLVIVRARPESSSPVRSWPRISPVFASPTGPSALPRPWQTVWAARRCTSRR